MDKIFQEEQKNLAGIESKIDVIASRYEVNAAKIKAEIDDFYCVDYEDRDQLKYLRNCNRVARETAEKYRAYQPEPYFGRLDLDQENGDEVNTISVYIGREGISDSSDILVLDWRSPIGTCFYAVNQRNFHIGDIDYALALRRRLEIKDARLISLKTEYDGESVSLEGELIDPFLLTVLKDKRRHNRLTDIIRTIQDNQNEIIRRPQRESFVVQGCAGSGKTMILLHRLSYLKFNNRSMGLSGVKILTPNKFFDAHINELSNELGLSGIDRLSVEEYYVSLIKRFSNKLTVDPAVISEKTMNPDLLRELYSVQYQMDEIGHYHEYWEHVIQSLDENRLRHLFARFGAMYPDTNIHTNGTYTSLAQSLSRIDLTVKEHNKQKELLQKRISRTHTEQKNLEQEKERVQKSMDSIISQTVLRLDVELENLNNEIQTTKTKISEVKKLYSSIGGKYESMEEERQDYMMQLQLIRDNRALYENAGTLVNMTDPIAAEIKSVCGTILSDISQVDEELPKVPIYNFGKKNALKRKQTDLNNVFSMKANRFLDARWNRAEMKISELQPEITRAQEKLADLKQEREGLEEKQNNTQKLYTAYMECLNLFKQNKSPDTKLMLTESTHYICGEILAAYEKQEIIVKNILRRIEQMEKTVVGLSEDKRKFEENAISAEDEEYIQECIQTVKKLQLNDISRAVLYHDMMAKYREYGQSYQKSNYRHRLYLKLLFCLLYFQRLLTPDNFLNIDEAQDISVSEYKLLRSVLGEHCIFNLYGDINQSVYSYKGITDWEEIQEITGGTVYVLNQNYRNTLQITNFCNEEFDAEVYAIGIAGDPVQEMHMDSALQWIIRYRRENPDARVAVLYRHGVKAIQEALKERLKGEDISWHAIDDSKISVVSVETAKGLEFEAVVVLVDQMSNNERYISYTRALDSLVVVRDPFAKELVEDAEDAGNIDPDFVDGEIRVEESYPSEGMDTVENLKERIPMVLELENTLQTRIEMLSRIAQQTDDNEVSANDRTDMAVPVLNEQEPPEQAVVAKRIHENKDSSQINALIYEFNQHLENAFEEPVQLDTIQKDVISELVQKKNVACDAPSGSMKSIILYLLALDAHQKKGKQTILTGEAHLQENELVLAERLGLRGGIIESHSMDSFKNDFKKEKYDVIFVPYTFFESVKNCKEFVDYFVDKTVYWGVDHPLLEKEKWPMMKELGEKIGTTMYLMSKEGYGDLDLTGFSVHTCEAATDSEDAQKLTFIDYKGKLNWLSDHVSLFYGQGIIYCDEEPMCKQISKCLRKKKIKAEAYIDVYSDSNKERINYLTNSFSCGGLPVLVTTHDVGKNLTNPNIRFILHFDVPKDKQVYDLHAMQLGSLSEDHVMIDLHNL